MEQNSQNYEEMDIDLNQYIKVLAKRKKTFVRVFLSILAIGLAYIVLAPKIYKITMIIQTPITEESLSEKESPSLNMSENLKFLVINKAFNTEIMKKLDLDPLKTDLYFYVSIPSNTNLMELSINERSKDRELGIKILTVLYDIVFKKYSGLIQLKNDEIDNEIKIIINNIVSLKENVDPLEERLKEITLRQEKLYDEIKSVSANTTDLVNKRDILLKNASKDNEMSSLLYSNTIQLNLGYINQLNNQLADFKSRAIDRRSEIKNLKTQIDNYQIEIDKLKLKKQLFSNLKILKEPEASRYPISPSKKRSLILSIFLGFISAVSAVFLQEYWKNNLKKHD
ncbi:MAG: Wzz/FepE/Etk N-terminal domain-containing protein [Candidatus Omnitrophota bacterium]|jgi:uncharacterized protein involved in exopolysaccharide biosynthesis